jgi:site-specific DNA-cytosine methylase
MIHAIDLFSGAGGWSCAARGLPIRVVAAVDFWEPATITYGLNFPDTHIIQGDLRDPEVIESVVAIAERENVSVVLGGIPCEWLSVYRSLQKVSTEERDRNREALDSALAIVSRISPRWWCMEDVTQIIGELPPFTPYHVFDARHWSGQRRKRCFVGDYPMPQRDSTGAAKMLRDYIRPGPYRIGRRLFGRTPQRARTFSKTTCLAAELDRKAPTVLSQCSRRDAELAIVDPSVPGGMRNPEWQEMAAVQGFPSDYLFYGSPTDVMKQVGRAVPIPLARAILQGICAADAKRIDAETAVAS